MKTIFTLIVTSLLLSSQAFAGGFWKTYKETVVVGGGAAIYGYTNANEGEELQQAALYGVSAGLLTYGIKMYFQKDLDKGQATEVKRLKNIIKLQRLKDQQRRSQGEDVSVGVVVRTVQPGKKLSNGEVVGETVREKLIYPGDGLMMGHDD